MVDVTRDSKSRGRTTASGNDLQTKESFFLNSHPKQQMNATPHRLIRAHHRQLLPRSSGGHKIACLALYRALLEQCPRVPLPDDLPRAGPVNPIKHLIRKRFKKDVPISSPRLAVNALKVGYAAEQLLRTAGDGSAPALLEIHTLLRLQHARAEASRQICKPPPPTEPPPRVGPYHGAPKLLDVRPLPLEKLSGRRQVPILTQTNGFPFLRTGKPQSPYLSRVLRNKIAQKDKWHKAMLRHDRASEDGEDEAAWEEIVRGELEKNGGPREDWLRNGGKDWASGDRSWVVEVVKAKETVRRLVLNDLYRTKRLGERMTAVVKQENRLWRQERSWRKHGRNDDRRERKRAEAEPRDDSSGRTNGDE